MKLTTHIPLVPRFKVSGAIPLLPLYAFVVQKGKTLPFLYVKHFTTVAFEKQDDLNLFTIKYSDGAYA
jgi:hypothetical protein